MKIAFILVLLIQSAFARKDYIDPVYSFTVDTYEKICEQNNSRPDVSVANLKNICEVVVKSDFCSNVPKDKLIDCSKIQNEPLVSKWEFYLGCTKGVFKSAKDILGFLWDVLKAVYNYDETYEKAGDYFEVTKLYLHTEYEKAYARTSGPFRTVKAIYELDDAISTIILDRLSSLIAEKYPTYGCYSFEAKSEMVCRFTGNIVFPPANVIAILKYGGKAGPYVEKFLETIKIARAPPLVKISSRLAVEYESVAGKLVENWKKLFGQLGQISGRGKKAESIAHKLKSNGIGNFDDARLFMSDGVGVRLILKTDSAGVIPKANIQEFVDKLCLEIKNGLRVVEVENYRGPGLDAIPYLSDAQVAQIARADAAYMEKLYKLKSLGKKVTIPEPISIKSGKRAIKDTGYTTLQINIEDATGMVSELQVRGPLLHEISKVEHIYYDLKSRKGISEKLATNEEIKKVIEAYKRLNETQKNALESYMRQQYEFARSLETRGGLSIKVPELPNGIPEILSVQNIRSLLK